MPDQIYILAGAVHSGKTTALQAFCKTKADAGGILSPVIEGSRWFQDVYSGVIFAMEAEADDDVFTIGKYKFNKSAFERAAGIIRNSFETEWLIIDEIGPLELQGEGFSAVIKEALASQQVQNLLVVVRETVLNEVIKHFRISDYKVLDTEALKLL
jgi:nucleoside-triphosphatase THEP1